MIKISLTINRLAYHVRLPLLMLALLFLSNCKTVHDSSDEQNVVGAHPIYFTFDQYMDIGAAFNQSVDDAFTNGPKQLCAAFGHLTGGQSRDHIGIWIIDQPKPCTDSGSYTSPANLLILPYQVSGTDSLVIMSDETLNAKAIGDTMLNAASNDELEDLCFGSYSEVCDFDVGHAVPKINMK